MGQDRGRRVNRILILVTLAALLGSLLLAHWNDVLVYGTLL